MHGPEGGLDAQRYISEPSGGKSTSSHNIESAFQATNAAITQADVDILQVAYLR